MGLAYGERSEGDTVDSEVDEFPRAVERAYTAAYLQTDTGNAYKPTEGRAIIRARPSRRVEIDHVDPSRAPFHPAARNALGIVIEDRLAIEISLNETNYTPVAQIDGRDDLHERSTIRLLTRVAPRNTRRDDNITPKGPRGDVALRNIDFDALRSLRDRHGAAFPRGRILFREGDTSAEFYVILQGSVELSIKDKATGNKTVLHVAQAGAFFGEMSCFSGLPRSATATAAEDSVLLFFNQDTAIQLLRASPRFALGVIQTLCDRIRAANERIATLADSAGGTSPPVTAPPSGPRAMPAGLAQTAAAAARAARPQEAREIPAADYDRATLWAKTVECPVSRTRFGALNVRPDVLSVKSRDTDFREVYGGPNPLWYLVYVCPECRYAAYPDDFAGPSADEIERLRNSTSERGVIGGSCDFAGARGLADGVTAYQLAIASYAMRAENPQRLGGLYHRLAWLHREAGDADAEMAALRQAVAEYTRAASASSPADMTLLYTIGELHLRLGDPSNAIRFFAQTSQHPDFKRQPDIQRLCRDRWTAARAAPRPSAS